MRDMSATNYLDLMYYGGLVDTLCAIANLVSSLGEYETRHLLNAMIGLAGVVGCWRLGRVFAGARGGFWAALLLAATPYYYGQMFNNPKDVPFAAFAVWGLYYLVRAVPQLPWVPWRFAVKLGVAVGLALGVRVGGFLLLGYTLAAIAMPATLAGLRTRSWTVGAGFCGKGVLTLLLPALAISYAVMLAFWPWAQLDWVGHPWRALVQFSHVPHPVPMLFDGVRVNSTDLPDDYVPLNLLLRLPEIVLLAVVAAPILGAHGLVRRRIVPSWQATCGLLVLALSIFFPVAYVIAIHAVLFDGIRHLTFILPPIAVVAGLGMGLLLEELSRPRHYLRAAVAGATALYFCVHIIILAQLHPDEYVYFNQIVGGPDDAAGKFEMDYWANSYAEAVDKLEEKLRAQLPRRYARTIFHVMVCGPTLSASYYFPRNFKLVKDPADADFEVAFPSFDCDRRFGGHPIVQVERMGALLSSVIDLRQGPRLAGRLGPRSASPGR